MDAVKEAQTQTEMWKFQKCKTNLARTNFALELLNQVGGERTLTKLFLKSNKKSVKVRESGNTFYRKKNYFKALECYTTSIALAETPKVLSLGYANRSAVLAKLGLHAECLTDIERALESDYPEELQHKLVSRREKVLILVKPPQNKNTPESDECVKVAEDEKYGRHMVATRDIQIGEVLLVEQPTGAVLTQDFSTYCHECLALCYNPVPCDHCSKRLFCGHKCRNATHQYECPILGALEDELLAFKITLSVIRLMKSGDQHCYNQISEMKTDEMNPKKQSALYLAAFRVARIFKVLGEKTTFFGDFDGYQDIFKELMLRVILVGNVNGVYVARVEIRKPKTEIVTYGKAIYLKYSLFNHSCCPNAFFYHDGTTMVVRALGTIKKGEQCFISYCTTFATATKSERQKLLLDHFNFVCTCRACEENWPEDDPGEEMFVPLMCVRNAQENLDFDLLKSLAPVFIRRLQQIEEYAPVRNLGALRQLVVDCYQVYQPSRV